MPEVKKLSGFLISNKEEKDLTDNDYGINRLMEAAIAKDIDLKIFNPSQFELVVSKHDERSIIIDDKHTELPDFVLPRTGSATTYYALSVLRQLKHMGVYLCNDDESIVSVKDKLFMHQMLAHSKLPTPKTMLAKFPLKISIVKKEIGFPLIIKNISGSFGNGIYLCESEEKFTDVMELIYSTNEKANIIIQEFVESSRGKDLRVFVLGGRAIACMQRSSEVSFKANFSRGGKVASFELTPEIEWLATEAAKLANLDIAGIDLLFDGSSFKVCEANSAPDFKGLEQVVGKNIAENIMDFIKIRLGSN